MHVVNSLMFALVQRDTGTAEHSRQVAELCVTVARTMLPPSECFTLEVAGLLHDIGKVTLPDEILLKPGPLTDNEWKVMHEHDLRGSEIVTAMIPSPLLVEIVRDHHIWYRDEKALPGVPQGEDIPLGGRLLAIADAFSAIVSDRPYRSGASYADAFKELRRCKGTQFDPDLVDKFIEVVGERSVAPASPKSAKRTVSNAVKREIDLEVEKLSIALKASDMDMLLVVSGRLAAIAAKQGLALLAELAAEVELAAAADEELIKVSQLAARLVAVCTTGGQRYLTPVKEETNSGGDVQDPASAELDNNH